MSEKLLVIISTAEAEKACTGAMYAVNSLKHGWMEEVELIFFGPAERLLLEDESLQDYLAEFKRMEGNAVACKFISDQEKTSDALREIGIEVDYVGSMIADFIKQGYVPMVW